MLKVTIYQNCDANANAETSLNTTSELSLNTASTRANISKVVGTICNETFHTMSVYNAVGSKFVSCRYPVQIRMNIDGVVLDTGTLERDLSASLRIGNTAKGKRRFAQRLNVLVNFMLHTVTVVSYDKVDAELTAEITALLAEQK